MTYVTCPIRRYHPAVVAQKAATMQLLSDGRFTLYRRCCARPHQREKSCNRPIFALNADGVGLLRSGHFASPMARVAWTGWRPC